MRHWPALLTAVRLTFAAYLWEQASIDHELCCVLEHKHKHEFICHPSQ